MLPVLNAETATAGMVGGSLSAPATAVAVAVLPVGPVATGLGLGPNEQQGEACRAHKHTSLHQGAALTPRTPPSHTFPGSVANGEEWIVAGLETHFRKVCSG